MLMVTTHFILSMSAGESIDGDPWWTQWVTPTGIESLAKTGGLVVLAWALLSGKIITSRMHEARVADLVKQHDDRAKEQDDHHGREIAQKDAAYEAMVQSKDQAYSEMKESRDYYRDSRLEEKARADRATSQLTETTEVARAAAHALQALGQVASEGGA